jgi:hypothetical protein
MKNAHTLGILLLCTVLRPLPDDLPPSHGPAHHPPVRMEARIDKGVTILLMLGMLYGVWRVVEARRKH